MLGDFGVSFSPTGKADQQQGGPSQTPLQDAIKVLSLRIPQFAGAGRGIAPHELLTGAGSAGVPGAAGSPGGLEEFLRRVFGQMGGGMSAPQSPPMPNIGVGGPFRQPPGLSAPGPMPGGVVNPGSFQPSGEISRPAPPMQTGQKPFLPTA